jgi:hypothetical protein
MTVNNDLEMIFWSLAYQLPWLLCCVAGILLAIFYRRYARVPCLLVALGCLVFLLTSLVQSGLVALRLRGGELMNLQQTVHLADWLEILNTAVQGCGLLLLVAAALTGRRPPPPVVEYPRRRSEPHEPTEILLPPDSPGAEQRRP